MTRNHVMHCRFVTTDVFTSTPFAGNPLAVFPDARNISDAQMAALAREFNLSETVFVLPPRDPRHTRHVRIFTPAREVPFAGHPTIGTAIVLAAAGYVAPAQDGDISLVLEEGVGPVHVTVRMENNIPVFAQLSVRKLPEVGPSPLDRATIATMLSLTPADIVAAPDAIETFSCGLPFLFVPLVDRAAVTRSRPIGMLHGQDVFVFARSGEDVYARMFAPEIGVIEDPATGSAVAALGGYLAARDPRATGTLRWTVTQGVDMGRPSRLELEVDRADGHVTAVRVGGSAVLISEGSMRVD
jgi:trans-2,3-dihydro-3-hydroxyanthranilate isomerase